jgi:hypothetical protein
MVIIYIIIFSYLNKNVVTDSLNAIFAACYDLIHVGYNITLKFGFCNIHFVDRNLTYTFSPEINERLDNLVESETRVIYYINFLVKKRNYSSFQFLEDYCSIKMG